MKIRTLMEARKSLGEAGVDLARIQWAKQQFDNLKEIDSIHTNKRLATFCMLVWPQHTNDPRHKKLWRDEVELKLEYIEKYMESVYAYARHKWHIDLKPKLTANTKYRMGSLPVIVKRPFKPERSI